MITEKPPIVFAKEESLSPLQDLGVVEFSVPVNNVDSVTSVAPVTNQESSDNLPSSSGVDSTALETEISLPVEPKLVFATDSINSVPNNVLNSEINEVEPLEILNSYSDQLQQALTHPCLDKDDFGAGLENILKLLTEKNSDFEAVAAYQKHLIEEPKNFSDSLLAQRLEVGFLKVIDLRQQLCGRVDQLLDSFSQHNNWPRLLGAWQLLHQENFKSIVVDNHWLDTLIQLSLSLFGEAQQAKLTKFLAKKDHTLEQFLTAYVEKFDSLSAEQKHSLIELLTTSLSVSDQPPQSQLQPTSSELVAAQAEISALKTQLKQLNFSQQQTDRAQDAEAIARFDQLQHQIINLTSEISDLIVQLDSLTREKSLTDQHLATLSQQLEDLGHENASLKQELYRQKQLNSDKAVHSEITTIEESKPYLSQEETLSSNLSDQSTEEKTTVFEPIQESNNDLAPPVNIFQTVESTPAFEAPSYRLRALGFDRRRLSATWQSARLAGESPSFISVSKDVRKILSGKVA